MERFGAIEQICFELALMMNPFFSFPVDFFYMLKRASW